MSGHSASTPPDRPPTPTLRASSRRARSGTRRSCDRAGYGIYRSSPGGRFLEANLRARHDARIRIAPSELLALDLADDVYLDPEERDRLAAARAATSVFRSGWTRAGSGVDGSADHRASLRAPDASTMTGDVEAFDGIVEDVTERQRHEELLRRSERMASLGTTLAGVAHELNNPLAAIMGFAQLLLKKPWPAEDRAALETINHEAMRSATIVKDLLALARKRDVERRVAHRRERHRRLHRAHAALRAGDGGHRLPAGARPDLPAVYGDRAQLEQVHVQSPKQRRAGAARADRRRRGTPPAADPASARATTSSDVVIEVEDNGPGMPESARTHIWDPFWTTKAEGEGTGLGLAVVHGDRHRSWRHDHRERSPGLRGALRDPDADREAKRRAPPPRGRRCVRSTCWWWTPARPTCCSWSAFSPRAAMR